MPYEDAISAAPFPLTRWSLVGRAGGPTFDSPEGRQALDELIRRYLPALRTHLVLTRRLSRDDADELLQGFVASKVLESRLFGRADPAQGKFRTFLLAALGNYLIDTVRARNAQKRTADRDAVAIAEEHADLPDRREAPSAAFEAAWARQVLERAIELTREECVSPDKAAVWGVLEARVLKPALNGSEPAGYETLVKQFGLSSPDQASNVLVTGKRLFARCLRKAVGEYAGEEEIEQELMELKVALGR